MCGDSCEAPYEALPASAEGSPTKKPRCLAVGMKLHRDLPEDEFVNEIPGGFDEVQSIEGCSTRDNTDDDIYVRCPNFDFYIGADWSDVDISSDIEENRVFEERGYSNCLEECRKCGKEFTCQMDLNAHELGHQNEVLFQCHFKNCQSGYKKASMLKSHLRKRHPSYWHVVGNILDQKILAQELLRPSDSMYTAIERIRKEELSLNRARIETERI